tara:strand:- start:1018 stop:1203 length:186 start_codon:yes stop_codon:yes gene_type:complete
MASDNLDKEKREKILVRSKFLKKFPLKLKILTLAPLQLLPFGEFNSPCVKISIRFKKKLSF